MSIVVYVCQTESLNEHWCVMCVTITCGRACGFDSMNGL